MATVTAKCFQAKPLQVEREWYSISAAEQPLGRLASRIAVVLMGKHKPTYTPHVDTGGFVIVTDAERVTLSGRKVEIMEHDYYTYHTSGRKVIPYKVMMEKHPDQVIELAVRRMLPKSALGRRMMTKLKVFRGAGPQHKFVTQKPQPLPKVR